MMLQRTILSAFAIRINAHRSRTPLMNKPRFSAWPVRPSDKG